MTYFEWVKYLCAFEYHYKERKMYLYLKPVCGGN